MLMVANGLEKFKLVFNQQLRQRKKKRQTETLQFDSCASSSGLGNVNSI